MLIVHKKFNPRKLSIFCYFIEIVAVQLSVLTGHLNIISVYRSPLCEIASFKTKHVASYQVVP